MIAPFWGFRVNYRMRFYKGNNAKTCMVMHGKKAFRQGKVCMKVQARDTLL
jgi:hypothetical protein